MTERVTAERLAELVVGIGLVNARDQQISDEPTERHIGNLKLALFYKSYLELQAEEWEEKAQKTLDRARPRLVAQELILAHFSLQDFKEASLTLFQALFTEWQIDETQLVYIEAEKKE